MSIRVILIIVVLSFCTAFGAARNTGDSGMREWQSLLNEVVADDEETLDWETVYDALCDLEDNPVDINTATKEDMERIPFLDENEVADILEYVYRNEEMLSKQELIAVASLSATKRTLLEYFITVKPMKRKGFPSLKTLAKYGDNTLLVSGNIPFYDRKGDENGYLGYKYKHNVKYDHRYGDYLRIGFVGAQDAGEPFFASPNKWGYDFYSYYITLRKLGRLKNLTLGKYRISMGMGLAINNNLSFGKTMAADAIGRSATAIRPHSSRSAANYLQGAAATVNVCRNIDVTAFISARNIDATLNDDNTIATILKTGYHRTATEIAKKDNASQFAAGANVTFSPGRMQFGLTAVYASLSAELCPNTAQVYRRYYAAGKEFFNMSANYGYRSGRFSFSGETATGSCHALATVNTASYRLLSTLTLNAIQRYYSYRYTSLFARSFSEGGAAQNESGVYLGVKWQPSRRLSVSYYADAAYFPWAKYQASVASHSFDNMLTAEYTAGEFTLMARYRLKIREKDNADKTALIDQTTQRGRFSVRYSADKWNAKAQFDAASSRYHDDSFGYMLTASGGCMAVNRLAVYASAAYFHTQDYNSRIYSYERGIAYDFSFPSYYGEGIRYALMLTASVLRNVAITAKCGVTNYFDRCSIGTGLQQTNHSSVTDMQLQMKWKF